MRKLIKYQYHLTLNYINNDTSILISEKCISTLISNFNCLTVDSWRYSRKAMKILKYPVYYTMVSISLEIADSVSCARHKTEKYWSLLQHVILVYNSTKFCVITWRILQHVCNGFIGVLCFFNLLNNEIKLQNIFLVYEILWPPASDILEIQI